MLVGDGDGVEGGDGGAYTRKALGGIVSTGYDAGGLEGEEGTATGMYGEGSGEEGSVTGEYGDGGGE